MGRVGSIWAHGIDHDLRQGGGELLGEPIEYVSLMEAAGWSALEPRIRPVKQGVAISESPAHEVTMKGGFLGSLAAHGLWRIGVRHSLGLVSARWQFMILGDSEITSP